MSIAQKYPLYVGKAEKKGSSKGEVDHIILWLTGYFYGETEAQI